MAETASKTKKSILGGVGLGGVLLAVLGFVGKDLWVDWKARGDALQALSVKVVSLEDDRRENAAQWRSLTRSDERLTELYIRVRVLEELRTEARKKIAEVKAPKTTVKVEKPDAPNWPLLLPPPSLEDKARIKARKDAQALIDEVRKLNGMNGMRKDPDEYRQHQIQQMEQRTLEKR